MVSNGKGKQYNIQIHTVVLYLWVYTVTNKHCWGLERFDFFSAEPTTNVVTDDIFEMWTFLIWLTKHYKY